MENLKWLTKEATLYIFEVFIPFIYFIFLYARSVGSDGSMSASSSSGPGFDPRRESKFSFENFQPRG